MIFWRDKAVEKNNEESIMSWPFNGGLLFFLTALTFYYFSVLDINYKKTPLLDLQPGPDAAEYFAQARELQNGRRPLIQIGNELLPSAFPPGYPAMMVPWLKILPSRNAVLAPFRTNQTIGLFLLFVIYGFYLYLRMPLAGGVATLLLATLPGFITFCRSSMSDPCAWFLYVLAFIFCYLGLTEERRWKLYVSAALLGLSMNVRLQSVFFAPLLLAMPLFPARKGFWPWFWHCAASGLVFLLAASPFLVVNYIEFHSPFRIGGNFWYPPRQLFSLQFILTKNVALFWREVTLQPMGYLAANIFGTGTVVVPAFALLILVGMFFLPMNRAVVCIVVTELIFAFLTACYLYPDGRYYLQLLILLLPVATFPVVWALRNLLIPKKVVAALGVLVLFVAACLGFPSRSYDNSVAIDRFQAWDALRFGKWPTQSCSWRAERDFAETCGDRPGIVFSDIDPVYLNALLPKAFAAAPIDKKQVHRWSPTWHYDTPQAATLAKQGLEHSLPVYALLVSGKERDDALLRLPKIGGYRWAEVKSRTSAVVLQLVPGT